MQLGYQSTHWHTPGQIACCMSSLASFAHALHRIEGYILTMEGLVPSDPTEF